MYLFISTYFIVIILITSVSAQNMNQSIHQQILLFSVIQYRVKLV